MYKIDYARTCSNTKLHLDQMTKLIESGCYKVKHVDLFNITENTEMKDLVEVKHHTACDQILLHDLDIISRLNVDTKRIIYCVHLLNIKRKNLRNDYETEGYSFGNPFHTYQQALKEFGITQFQFIEYAE